MTGIAARLARRLPVVLLFLILALTAGSRFYRFGQVPPGPHYDEAAKVLDALDVLAGHHTPFSLRSYGREMLHIYVSAPFVALMGPTYLALRLVTALLGILTPLAIYWFTLELLGERDRRVAQWTGLLAALFFAVSYWALAVNRIGFRANYVPLLATLCFLFFWRAVRTGRWWDYGVSGLFLGLVLNTYISSRFVPVVLGLFVAGWAFARSARTLILRRWRGWLLLIGTALLVFAPLLIYFLTHPGSFLMRAGGLSLFNPALNHGDFWGLLGRSVLGNLGLFGFTGDPNWVYNIPHRPAMDAVPSVLFWIGFLLCLLRWKQPRFAFLLVWVAVMLLPGILAPDPIPHFLRTFGALPAACIVAALPAIELISFLSRRSPDLRTAVPMAGGICLLLAAGWSGYRTWHDYFDVWAGSDQVYYAYNGHMPTWPGRWTRIRTPRPSTSFRSTMIAGVTSSTNTRWSCCTVVRCLSVISSWMTPPLPAI
jgi:4-amino-4-deoxy-L-arabinose transferase-like glycosyltransferase